ncbi:hypothetical protein BUE80_DR011341 [Diplocarpon rosae]|nr:hypothetical protein BUE80_DR011341 [Diplocarpon rosae]
MNGYNDDDEDMRHARRLVGGNLDAYSDAVLSSSPPQRQHAFAVSEVPSYDLETGFLNTEPNSNPNRKDIIDTPASCISKSPKAWWRITSAALRKGSLDSEDSGAEYKDEGRVPLLATAGTEYPALSKFGSRRRSRTKRCCVFGGISGLTILALLLSTNLILTILTLFLPSLSPFSEYHDPVLSNWGAPGTGTSSLSWYPTDFTRDIVPIACHSHNDYWRRVPLFSALRAGCISVEADVWLFPGGGDGDGELYVGHNRASLTPNRTFAALYIDPLVRILENQNPSTEFSNETVNGVFDVDPGQSLTLLVDIKTAGAETWRAVERQLQPLRERGWLSFVRGGELYMRAVTVVGTGNAPFDFLTRGEDYRDAFFDAPLEGMEVLPRSSTSSSPSSPSTLEPSNTQDQGQGQTGTLPNTTFTRLNSHYASTPFAHSIGRIWRGRLSRSQVSKIRAQIKGAHARGLRARYWDLPAWPLGVRDHVWRVLVEEGADVLNVDDLRGVRGVVW